MTSTETSPIGLAFSGGGIRSAAFCSGVLRRLLQRNMQVDYLSCVSGGGYTGTAFLDWKYREETMKDEQHEERRHWHPTFFRYMRKRAGYFCNWEKPLVGILDTAILVCLVLLVNVIGPIVMWGSYACPVAYIIDLLFGKYLREKLDCEKVANYSTTEQNATREEEKQHCLSRQGTEDSYTIILFSFLLVFFAVFFILAKRTSRKRYSTPLSFIHTTLAVVFGLTFLPFTIKEFVVKIPIWTQYLTVSVAIMIWCFFPLLRTKTSYVLLVYFFSYVTYWKVYEAVFFGIPFSSELFNRLLFISGIALWFVPFITALHVRLMHVYNRWRLQKAFYHPEGVGKCGCSGIGIQDICPLWTCSKGTDEIEQQQQQQQQMKYIHLQEKKSLTLYDLKKTKPEYISNIVVNRWKKSDESVDNYELLTMSPTLIERLDSRPHEGEFQKQLEPKDVKLSDAMATSAAAISSHMGKYDTSVQGLTRLHTLLGLEMGARMISDIQAVKNENVVCKILPFVVDILRALPLISVPALFYYSDCTTETRIKHGVVSFIVIHFVLAFIAVIDTGKENPQWWEKLSRWFIVHNSFVNFVREIFSKNNTGPIPPPIMFLSDGGHAENLALLPLLKKRLKRIIVVDGGYKHDQKLYGESLLNALMLARTKLKCSFLSVGGKDVISDVMEKFVSPVKETGGKRPRFYTFKVWYYEEEVGGKVLLITPRKPDEGYNDVVDGIFDPTPPFDDVDGLQVNGMVLSEGDVNKLTFCCCECCHDQPCCGVSNFCCNVFPQHTTANQFFTPRMFEAYHREGYRACVEAEQDDFMKYIGDRSVIVDIEA